MKPQGGGEPPTGSKLAAAIARDFGSQKALEEVRGEGAGQKGKAQAVPEAPTCSRAPAVGLCVSGARIHTRQ